MSSDRTTSLPAARPGGAPEDGGRRRGSVPVRAVLTTIGLVVAALLALLAVRAAYRVLVWLVVALVLAVAVRPAVEWLQRRVPRCPRALATLAVFTLVVAGIAGVIAAIVTPLAREAAGLSADLPRIVEDARAGRGPGGELLQRLEVADWLERNQQRIGETVTGLGPSALGFVRAAATGIVAFLTVLTAAFLMVLHGPRLLGDGLRLLRPATAERLRRVGRECERTITGYVSGNLLISAVCGVLTYAVLRVLGVPFPGLLALFVAVADLVPLVGATIGATVATLAAFTQGTETGVVVGVFFVVYQQVENHVLQPLIYARTVQLNALGVLVALLVLTELAGVVGALLAIPAAGIVRALVRDQLAHRRR